MAETIYTIPINEAFDACAESEAPQCPLCRLYNKFEADETLTDSRRVYDGTGCQD